MRHLSKLSSIKYADWTYINLSLKRESVVDAVEAKVFTQQIYLSRELFLQQKTRLDSPIDYSTVATGCGQCKPGE